MAIQGDIYKVALPNGDEYNFKDKYVRENYRTLNNNDFDTINVTELNSGNIVNTGAARFLNTINGSISGNAATATNATNDANGLKIDTGYLKLSGGTMTGTIKYNDTTGSEILRIGSYNKDTSIFRVYTSDIAYSATSAYGFTLKYMGTGNANDNKLILYSDNQTAATQVAAITVDQAGVVTFPKTISGSITGSASSATTASKLGTDAGSATNPVYFSNGVPVGCTHSLNKTVPADAIFTDTKYILDVSGNNVILKKDGTTQDTITVPYSSDSGKLNGYASDTTASNNTIARRTANGYMFATYFNQSSGAETPTTNSYIIYANSDGYFRKSTIANVAKILSPYEAKLLWGGDSRYGSVTPIGMSLSNEHSANRLAFINGECITAEYSSDGGETWTNYGYSNTVKSSLFTIGNTNVTVGRPSGDTEITLQSRSRITITAQNGTTLYVYTNPRKMLINVTTAGGLQVLIETRTGTNYLNDGAWTIFGTYTLSGWSGWNDIPLILSTLGGGSTQKGNIWQLRLTFIATSINTDAKKTCSIQGIRIYGENAWSTPSTYANTGHIYTFDMSKNVTFPANVTATKFIGPLQGNADTATSATKSTQDSDGNTINTTYLKKSGGTMTGGVTFLGGQSAARNDKGIIFTNGSRIGESTALGIYGCGDVYIRPNSASAASTDGICINANGLVPTNNNTENLGGTNNKWNTVYATTFNGSLDGNAATATKATQDGSGNTITSTYVKVAGDSMTGTLCMNSNSNNYGEGIRINAGANNYSTLTIGTVANSTSGISDKAFWIGTNRENANYARKLYIAHNTSVNSLTYFYATSSTDYSPSLQVGGAIVGRGVVCTNAANSETAGGLSLYGTDPTQYGVLFRTTANQGTHGYVTSDWATYFTMSNTNNRGWVFRRNGSGNVASIDTSGQMVLNGSLTLGGNEANTNGVRQVYNSTTNSLDFVFVA